MTKATALGMRSCETLSTARDWAAGIWNIRTRPAARVMMKMCQTSIRPVKIRVSISTASDASRTCTMTSRTRRGTMSAVAPANRARKLKPMRAEAVSPTRKGESVRFSTYHTTTTVSIWEAIPARVMADQTRPKLRSRSMDIGEAARPRLATRFNFTG